MQFYSYSIKVMGRKIHINKVFVKNESDAKKKARKELISAIKLNGIILD